MNLVNDATLLIGSYTERQHSPTSGVVHHSQTEPLALSGWTSLRVTAGIERMPRDFELEMTELAANPNEMLVKPGDSCILLLAGKPVLTGYVDVVAPSISPSGHSIRVVGRGKCADLVDCSAQWPGGQIPNSTVLEIATRLADVYGIAVSSSIDKAKLPTIPQFNLNLGESPFEIIERIARFSAVLCYEDENGNLQLSRAGTKTMESGIEEGINMEAASVSFSMHERYSELMAVMMSTQNFGDLNATEMPVFTARDPNVTRHRRRIIISEAGQLGWEVAGQRVQWEVARRAGKSRVVQVAVDNWTDVNGQLWQPNSLICISIPSLKIENEQMLISAVTFHLSEAGTHADLVLMPPEAFLPEPILIQKLFPELTTPAQTQ